MKFFINNNNKYYLGHKDNYPTIGNHNLNISITLMKYTVNKIMKCTNNFKLNIFNVEVYSSYEFLNYEYDLIHLTETIILK